MKFYISTAFLPTAEVIEIARAADELGYHGLGIPDHVVDFEEMATPYPYTEDGARRWDRFTDWPDPWVLIGSLAQCTRRLRFVNTVYVAALRDPFTAAKAIGTASVLSGGRVELGLGVGWSRDEFELMGARFEGRGRRTDEMVELMKSLWTPGWTEFNGESYSVPRVEMSPRPPRIPILIGGLSDRAFHRAAQHDGWIGDLMTTDEAITTTVRLRELREQYGRTSTDFSIIAPLTDAFTTDHYRYAEAAGITHILTMPWLLYSGGDVSTEQKILDLKRFRDDVLVHWPTT
ncbi:TIGR03619 family F420-dependent LLM class oxidoreductase [Williamsia sp. 1135]|uniref:TIGR03619 family F420-dependent LLM class oxidoreductase n=1 Tax=Williamsia sp. 1135 TaxID=1889262 RepID=UPI000A104860|nr:TIGR03619 family F420-dependent LLM class oxidoreductase [Williamsia sp. 1135]ORM37486.1 LLM class F420-dependent oxidoreductase [Williamsia sp. 1135]